MQSIIICLRHTYTAVGSYTSLESHSLNSALFR